MVGVAGATYEYCPRCAGLRLVSRSYGMVKQIDEILNVDPSSGVYGNRLEGYLERRETRHAESMSASWTGLDYEHNRAGIDIDKVAMDPY